MESENIVNCILKCGLLSVFYGEEKTSIDNMRGFHNWIKDSLIKLAVKNSSADSLLDLAVGRGGDLHKWTSNRINYVIGIDSDKASIFSDTRRGGDFDGAIARFRYLNNNRNLFYRFENISVLDPEVLEKLNRIDRQKLYSIVSCQFAFHYFTKDENSLRHTLRLVSQKLRPGGVFICTFTDGANIVNNGDVSLPSLKIKVNQNNYSLIIDAKTTQNRLNYFEIIDENVEYISLVDSISTIANEFGLDLILNRTFHEWYCEYKTSHKFRALGFQEMLISFLNTSIIFKKNSK
jgi:mRNA (guanine-N7-)-methyltransferase